MKKEAAPFLEEIKALRDRIILLVRIKDFKIPFYEKLPKDNQFYKHFMQNLNFKKMKDAAEMKANEDKEMFKEASGKIQEEKARAQSLSSPGFRTKKVPY